MDDLERQLHDYAGQLDELEPVTDDEILERAPVRPSGSRRAFLFAAAVLVVVVLGGAVIALASRGSETNGPVTPVETTVPPAPLRARIELPSDRLVAGGSMDGEVIVDNDTGAPIEMAGCGSIYQAGLAHDGYRQEMAWATCLRVFEVPVGESRWPVGVLARVHGCTNDETAVTYPRCLPSGELPLESAGSYEVFVAGVDPVLPVPDPVTIEIVDP